MLRYFFAAFFLVTCAVLALAGFRGQKSGLPPIEIFPDMDHQPKYQPQHPSSFFSDGRSARTPVSGSIPLGYHGRTGHGDGIVKQIGSWATVANLQDARIQSMPDGQIFSTITNGKNTMGAYGPQIAVEDRWAIVAYLRVLQRAQNGKLSDLTAEQRKEIEGEKK